MSERLLDKKLAGEKLAIFVLVEPRAFDVEKPDAGEAGKRKGVDRELCYRLVRPRIGLVVEDVDGAVSDLQKIDVAGDRAFGVCGEKSDAVLLFEGGNVVLGEPHRYLDSDRRRIVGKHEALKLGVALVIAADGGQYERCRVGRGILLADDDELVEREKIRRELGAPAAILSLEKIMRARLRNRFQEVGECRKSRGRGRAGRALVVERAVLEKCELRDGRRTHRLGGGRACGCGSLAPT
jgi:hypothetical protein